MKLIDANVVIYSLGYPHPYKESCQSVLARTHEQPVVATVDAELFQEVSHYYRRRKQLDYSLVVLDNLLAMFPDPLPVTRQTILIMRDLLARAPTVQTRDAIHAAVVLESGLEGIISADRGFDSIPGVKRFDPMQL